MDVFVERTGALAEDRAVFKAAFSYGITGQVSSIQGNFYLLSSKVAGNKGVLWSWCINEKSVNDLSNVCVSIICVW
jgi:hypothetical protein